MKKIFKILIVLGILGAVACASLGIYVYSCIQELDSSLYSRDNMLASFNSQVGYYDSDDQELVHASASGTRWVRASELSDHTKNAFIAIEDHSFYQHNGLNYMRIIKAGLNNLFSGYTKEGASTISQQLVKNTLLSSEKTMKRKIQEAYLATRLEEQYNKEEILETYLNVIYFGNSSIGIENAARTFFDRPATQLSLAQSATLAGIIKSPRSYSPIHNPEKCLTRRNVVLNQMLEQGMISQEEYQTAKAESLEVSDSKNLNQTSILRHALEEAGEILNLSEKDVALSGYKIYTYVNATLQEDLQENFGLLASRLAQEKQIDSVLTVLDNNTMGITALLSTSDYSRNKRQPGSLIKPLLCYAPAFESGILMPATPIKDEKVSFGNYTPRNVDGKESGWISVREALSKSKNITAVKTLEYVGLERAKSYAQKLGVEFDPEDNHLALALGAMKYGIDPVQMAASYSTFANGGQYAAPSFIRRIESKNGHIIYEHKAARSPALSAETSFLIDDVLRDTVKVGTAKKLSSLGMSLAAKTGTVGASNSDGNTDAWCVSFNPDFTVCAWSGNLSGDSQNNLSDSQNGGSIGATFNKFAWELLHSSAVFERPDDIQEVVLDLKDLESRHLLTLAGEDTPERFTKTELFAAAFVPTEVSKSFTELPAPRLSGKLNADKVTLWWQSEPDLVYDIYVDGKLTASQSSGKWQTTHTGNRVDYSVTARHTTADLSAESNTVTLYRELSSLDKNPLKNSSKKVRKTWFFN